MLQKPKSVFDLTVVTWGFFAKGYDKAKNHLGVDYRIGAGEKILSHVKGNITKVGGSGADQYMVIWDGSFSHVFGHLNFAIKGGPVEVGTELGTVAQPSGGAHLHYGLNKRQTLPLDNEWGWGKCPIKYTRSDAEQKGWVNPVLNVMSRALSMGRNSTPTILNP